MRTFPFVVLLAVLSSAACVPPVPPVDSGVEPPDAGEVDAGPGPDAGLSADRTRDILTTDLQLDLTALAGVATLSVAGSSSGRASFEVGDLDLTSVEDSSGPRAFQVDGGWVDVAVPAGVDPVTLTVRYGFKVHSNYNGWMPARGVSFLWPTFCGNLFPCHSAPADGVRFTMNVTGVPSGKVAVYPTSIPADAPSYMPAVAVGAYTYLQLGGTDAGTEVGVYYLPGQLAVAQTGTHNMTQAFDWYERTYGPYTFGNKVASVAAAWGAGGYGGMEHHPFWHVGSTSMSDQVTHYHEAAHGWFGDGVRIACWEDFVLSEGTVSYLAARAMQEVEGIDVWPQYQVDLDAAVAAGDTLALPDATCDVIDLLHDPLWSDIPYMKGAFFFRAVEQQVGAPALDAALATFYRAHVGRAATMQELLDTIHAETGFDPTTLANGWLRSLGHP